MPNYPLLASLAAGIKQGNGFDAYLKKVVPHLVNVWLDDYNRLYGAGSDIVETEVSGFSYLFDIARGRLIAAWGISRGKHRGRRPKERMAGHPQSAGPLFHRGHAIPHTMGGDTDINLVAQLGRVNIGPFRPLEIRGARDEEKGSLYFTYWIYADDQSQTPTSVEQGLLRPGHPPDIRSHTNTA